MTRWILADTSAIVGLFLRDDEWHDPAREALEGLKAARRRMLATSDIFDETVTAIRRWAGYRPSIEAGETLRTSRLITVVPVDEEVRESAWRRFRKMNDPHLSLTDCTSFAIMERFGIKEAFTFDTHFRRAGFEVLPRPDVGRA
ncbi:MAG TPA: PIN domain-containing protein [Planctomycetota bacterium]